MRFGFSYATTSQISATVRLVFSVCVRPRLVSRSIPHQSRHDLYVLPANDLNVSSSEKRAMPLSHLPTDLIVSKVATCKMEFRREWIGFRSHWKMKSKLKYDEFHRRILQYSKSLIQWWMFIIPVPNIYSVWSPPDIQLYLVCQTFHLVDPVRPDFSKSLEAFSLGDDRNGDNCDRRDVLHWNCRQPCWPLPCELCKNWTTRAGSQVNTFPVALTENFPQRYRKSKFEYGVGAPFCRRNILGWITGLTFLNVCHRLLKTFEDRII